MSNKELDTVYSSMLDAAKKRVKKEILSQIEEMQNEIISLREKSQRLETISNELLFISKRLLNLPKEVEAEQVAEVLTNGT